MSKAVSELLVVVQGGRSGFIQDIMARQHRLTADEPSGPGAGDMGPTPYELLLAALGACTSITLKMYARQKKWPLEEVVVRLGHSRIHAADCGECETKEGMLDRIDRELELKGPLTQEQKARLLEIAEKCPVHRTLTSEVNIRSWLA